MQRALRPGLAVVALSLLVAGSAFAKAGSLITSFGTGGIALVDLGSSDEAAADVSARPDGSLLVAGTTTPPGEDETQQIGVVRFAPGGGRDMDYGTDGAARFPGIAAAITTLAGNLAVVAGTPSSGGFTVAKFGAGGGQIFRRSEAIEGVRADDVAIQSDGKIIVAGEGRGELATMRLKPNGTKDGSYGIDGVGGLTEIGFPAVNQVTPLAGGKTLLTGAWRRNAGSPPSVVELTRLTRDGGRDATFAKAGRVRLNFGGFSAYGTSSVRLPDGKLLVGGSLVRRAKGLLFPFVARLTAKGAVDKTFGVKGVRVLNPNLGDVHALNRDASGIYASGGETPKAAKAMYVTRLTEKGAISKSFGTAGYVRFDWGVQETLAAADLAPGNRLVLVGDGDQGSRSDYAVAQISTK